MSRVVEHAAGDLVARGQQVFTISWKNVTKKEADWDFDS